MSCLPRDVLHNIFDAVELPHLIVLSHVSTLWRDTARAHPYYWKNLEISTASATRGRVNLFVERLRAKVECDATISLSLQLTSHSDLMRQIVLPAISEHIARVEGLSVVASAQFMQYILPLFTIAAPRLRFLQVVLEDAQCTPKSTILPALFHADRHSVLQYISLFGVSLPTPGRPLRHVVKALKAVCYDDPKQLAVVLHWIPRPEAVDLHFRTSLFTNDCGFPDNYSLQSVSHVVANSETCLQRALDALVPVITIRLHHAVSQSLHCAVPPGPVGMCFRRFFERGLLPAMTMDITFVSIQSHFVRHFDKVWVPAVFSVPVQTELRVIAARVVQMALPLELGFREFWRDRWIFPNLEVLKVVLNSLPDRPHIWSAGGMECPSLSTLILQREIQNKPATIAKSALNYFVNQALRLRRKNQCVLRVVLEDVTVVEDKRIHCDLVSLSQRRPEAAWEASTLETLGGIKHPRQICPRPRTDWLRL